jgi:poly(A) polymerase
MSKEIWCMQPRFEKRRGKRVLRLINERRFRAAYDFLLLRVLENRNCEELAHWWTEIQDVEPQARETVVQEGKKGGGRGRRRRPRKRKAVT